MAGTLTISTLSDGTNSTSSTNCIQGSAKAWVNFNGSTVAIRASYNVSSVTHTGTGAWTVNFSNALTDGNYAAVVTCSTDATTIATAQTWSAATNLSTSCRLNAAQTSATVAVDLAVITASFFR